MGRHLRLRIPEPQRCPRCRGTLATERDRWGAYDNCFLCGYSRDRQVGPTLLEHGDAAGD